MMMMMNNSTRRKQSRPNRHPEDDDDDDVQQSTVPSMSGATIENSIEQGVKMKTSECSVTVEEKKQKKKKKKKIEAEEDKIMISHTGTNDEFEDEGDDDDGLEEPEGTKRVDDEELEPPEVSRFDDLDDEAPLLEELSGEPPLKLESREGSAEKDSDESPELEKESLQAALQNLMVDFHWPEGTSITIERVESTKAAVAELTAAAIQSSTTDYSSASLQDLALIQSTLFTLQQQQIVQLQLVQQLLAQLAMCTGELDESMQECSSEPGSPVMRDSNNVNEAEQSARRKEPEKNDSSDKQAPASSSSETLSSKFASLLNCGNQDPNRPLSPGLAAQSSLNAILMPDDNNGGLSSLNTLEMLTKRAQEVLDSASQGLLASSMVDDSYKKGGGMSDRREPFFKHRCRYCGKVFGSDSALQIHIRSHTGERPYKCNVCGSRFTTKGNLKVHFQRHSQKFPHVKMNPHPVPEHLDHFHPPLLASGERSPDLVPTNLPFGPVPPAAAFTPMNFMRFDNPAAAAAAAAAAKLSLGFPLGREAAVASLEPEDLSKAKPKIKRSNDESEERMRREESRERSPAPRFEDEDEDDFDDENDEDEEPRDVEMSEEKLRGGEQPENLSSKSLPLMHSIPLQATTRPARPSSTSKISRSRRDSQSPGSKESLDKMDDLSLMDITKDPRSYAALLPRPGSASSAWESLIEVNTSSETSKLQQLVDNIDNQISDPNECVVCHRVLSCKSALQMHYRTHTGERPFKCRLCGRAFTTKGNLKTHMGVHRIKEGDAHHQCPVCHKRFTTQLVLQQHIRLHTGEPTELTFDQIRAGEIRDFIPNFVSPGSSSNSAAGISPFVSPPKDSRDTTTPGSAVSSSAAAASALFPEDLSKKVSSGPSTPSMLPAPPSRNSAQSPAADTTDSELSSSEWGGKHSESDTRATPPSASTTPGGGHPPPFLPLDLTPKNNIFSPFLPNLNPLMGNSALSSLANSVLNSTAAFNPMHMNVIAGRGATRGNTTCGLCFKTFACHSALEIHYRSHTKERPFKCTVCDRGFSTKGNMKQHMLTHKIRDMPASAFDPSKLQNQNSNSSACSSISSAAPVRMPEFNSKPETVPSKELCEREMDEPKKEHRDHPEEDSRASGHMIDDENSRSSIGGSTKHMCHVCQKGFSSSSSLHIHMRTHTGDKPFKCNVCQKAFTTKGNLKVHMGTHMWTSGASRRGRRMSLELPLGLQFNPHHHQGGDGRHFFPFVPPNFPGGPVNLAATKLVDYSLLRPPMQFPPGMIPTSAGPMFLGGAAASKDDKEEPPTTAAPATGDDDDDNDDAGSET